MAKCGQKRKVTFTKGDEKIVFDSVKDAREYFNMENPNWPATHYARPATKWRGWTIEPEPWEGPKKK